MQLKKTIQFLPLVYEIPVFVDVIDDFLHGSSTNFVLFLLLGLGGLSTVRFLSASFFYILMAEHRREKYFTSVLQALSSCRQGSFAYLPWL
jgi:hypothetical protein